MSLNQHPPPEAARAGVQRARTSAGPGVYTSTVYRVSGLYIYRVQALGFRVEDMEIQVGG